MKYSEKDRKLIPFLEDWSWDDEEKWRFFERDTMSLREIWTSKTMNKQKCSRENWKVLKTILKAQNTQFSWLGWVTNKSPNQATKHLGDKILKNLFKCFSWLEVPLVSKLQRELRKFLYNLATGAFTREQVAKPSSENCKNPEFWKIF